MKRIVEKIIEGELIDTYGGDFTYRDVRKVTYEDGEVKYFEKLYGINVEDSSWKEIEEEVV